ncbi:hypothetical protein ACIPN8_44295 [Streptomyces sp. NPDC086082]|uniref:hypothetical protein n=1 Tax=Streptomyces sp. NPDC086082 TaxID=3365750 RepID=UPI0037FC47C1
MNMRAKSLVTLLLAPLLGACLLAGCGDSPRANDEPTQSPQQQERRARQVADAWRGSASSAAWNKGYFPMGDAVQMPESGWHSKADERAYAAKNFALRGNLPTAATEHGMVDWDSGNTLTRPLITAKRAYQSLALNNSEGPRLTVTGARLDTTTITTSRGPATVSAWLFTLDGYDTPLKRVAITPSNLPPMPIEPARQGSAGGLWPVTRLVGASKDGQSVTVRATHGACDDGPVVKVLEADQSVVLYASIARAQSGPCSTQMIEQNVTVKLRKPLDDRILLDALTGRPVPYGDPNGPSPSWS